MDTQPGHSDALLAAYFEHEQQTLQGVQGSALGAHSFMLNGMSHGSANSQACAATSARQQQQQQNGLFMQGSSNSQGRVKQEQLEASSRGSASTAAAAAAAVLAAEQAASAAAAAARQSSSTAVPKYTSAFSMPNGMIPTPVTAAMGFNPAALGMQMQQPNPTWFAASAASSASSFAAALQHQQQQQLQQQHQLQQAQQQQQQQQQMFSRGSFSSTTLPAGTALQAVPAAANGLAAGAFGGPAAAAAAAAAAIAARAHSQTLSSTGLPTPLPADDEPDLSHLTVMQRYHARRKLAVQRMEREVEEKIAQLALLEQENRKLKWQAHILEHMLLDIDKQLEVMAHNDSTPDASQWLTLLGMGQPASTGGTARVARTVHRMLEGAGQVSVAGWTVQDCRKRWLAYLDALRPLMQQAEAAQAEYRSAQPPSGPDSGASGGAGSGGRRPRRAAAAAAVAVIQQEAADVLGVVPLPASNIPEPPAPASAAGSSPSLQLQQQADGDVVMQRTQSGCSSEHSQQGSESSVPPAHASSAEGVPQPLLSKIEQLVLDNFYWLLAVMTTNPVLTYEFISMDLIDGTRPLPPQEHRLWADAVEGVAATLDQMQECSTCIQVSRRCMAKVMEERAEIQESMQCSVESEMHTHLSEDVLQLNSRDAAVDRMRANVRKESVVRNMVGFYCINVFSLFQLAKVSLSCAPWFCMAWRVIGAMDEALAAQLAEAARQGGGRGLPGGHNTRASARIASQR